MLKIKPVKIGRHLIGENHPCYIIAEIGSNFNGDISRAKNELGYRPRIDLREGMRRSIQSALESGVAI